MQRSGFLHVNEAKSACRRTYIIKGLCMFRIKNAVCMRGSEFSSRDFQQMIAAWQGGVGRMLLIYNNGTMKISFTRFKN